MRYTTTFVMSIVAFLLLAACSVGERDEENTIVSVPECPEGNIYAEATFKADDCVYVDEEENVEEEEAEVPDPTTTPTPHVEEVEEDEDVSQDTTPSVNNNTDATGNVKIGRDCGPSGKPDSYWGPAGEAPQCEEDAADLLQADIMLLTIINPQQGDDTATGWIYGTQGSETSGMVLHAGHVPAGTCIDYDPGASTVEGEIAHSYDYPSGKWRRVVLSSDGSFTGLKMTVYWTPCDFPDGWKPSSEETSTSPSQDQQQQEEDPEATETCATIDPTHAVGGEWVYQGQNRFTLTGGAHTINGADDWVVHTPNHPGDPGLPAGSSETVDAATAYNESCNF